MGNFRGDGDRFGGGSSRGGFGGGSRGGDRGGRGGFGRRDERPEYFDVVCDECGADCQVPFKPTGDKPVLCSECFGRSKSRGGDFDRNDRSRGRDDRGGRRDSRDFGEKKMYSAVCDQCGADCELPFKPSSDKPVYCSDCFVKEDKPKRGGADYTAEFLAINTKLDMIIESLGLGEKEKVVHKLPKKEKAKVEEIIDEVVELEEKVAKKKAPAKKAK